MRRTPPACRSGLSLAAAVVLLTACGGSDEEDSASTATSASSSSAAGTSTSGAGSEFCTQAEEALDEVEPALSGSEDPAALALQEAADSVRAIEPPAEIDADWTALADGIEQFAQAFAEFDATDPASASAFQQRTSEIVTSLTDSASSVQTYLADECGLDVDATEPASPTT